MNLYIQVENGQTVNHPALESNLLEAFGSIPGNWEPFVRVEQPSVGVYEVLDPPQSSYQKVNGVWTDVWSLRQMTPAEKSAKQQAVKDAWTTHEFAANFSAWSFDEDTCSYLPPIAFPDPDSTTRMLWCGAENNWKAAPPVPQDDKPYKFDFFAWAWVVVP